MATTIGVRSCRARTPVPRPSDGAAAPTAPSSEKASGPVVSAVHQLTREDLVQILVEPKNALVKQYQRFFNYDTIDLVFTEDALWEISDHALERETGAPVDVAAFLGLDLSRVPAPAGAAR